MFGLSFPETPCGENGSRSARSIDDPSCNSGSSPSKNPDIATSHGPSMMLDSTLFRLVPAASPDRYAPRPGASWFALVSVETQITMMRMAFSTGGMRGPVITATGRVGIPTGMTISGVTCSKLYLDIGQPTVYVASFGERVGVPLQACCNPQCGPTGGGPCGCSSGFAHAIHLPCVSRTALRHP